MGRRETPYINTKTHFFKPLLPDFPTNFPIPKSFVKYLNINAQSHQLENDDDEKLAWLKDRREKTYWQVKIKDDHGVQYFRDGWDEFCKDHGLQVGDFLVFQHHGNLVFDVTIFDPSSCERETPSPLMVNASSSVDAKRNGSPMHGKQGSRKIRGQKACRLVSVSHKGRGYPYFQALVKSYWSRSGLLIPSKFARENGLVKGSCKIKVVHSKRKPWQLPLHHSNKNIYIGSWRRFHVANSLKVNQPIVFELISTKNSQPTFNFYKLS